MRQAAYGESVRTAGGDCLSIASVVSLKFGQWFARHSGCWGRVSNPPLLDCGVRGNDDRGLKTAVVVNEAV